MDARALDEIQRFLRAVGKESLFDYYSVRADAPDDVIAAALRDKRAWAQGQQSNPKYRQEAVWVIKNSGLSRRALIDERAAYLDALRSGEESRQAQVLALFIQGSLADGVLTPSAEAAIRQQGQRLGLAPSRVDAAIEAQLRQSGAVRTTPAPPADPWAELGLPRGADRAAIEQAYDEKSAFARRNPDGRVSGELLARLDAARQAALARPEAPTEVVAPASPTPVVSASPSEGRGAPAGPSPAAPVAAPPRNAPASPAAPAPPPEPLRPTPTLPPLAASAADSGVSGLRLAGAAPPAPPPGVARALPPGPEGAVARAPARACRLELEGPEQRAVTVGSHGRLTVVLHRVGAGPLPGRAFSDREWVTVDPPRFDLTAERQELTIRIDGRAMGRRRAVALVSFATDDGQRRSVTIDTRRRAVWPAAVGLAAAALVAAGAWWAGRQPPPPVAPQPTTLEVRVDPPAGQVFVNGALVSDNGSVTVREGLRDDAPAQVRVELDGFAPWSESVQVPARAKTLVAPSLVLTDPMDWRPAPEAVRAELDERAARKAIDARSAAWGACFAAHAEGAPGSTQSAELDLRVNARGAIAGVDVGAVSFPASPAWKACMLRQLRAIRMPLVSGDYASLHHTFRAALPSQGAP